MEQAIIMDNFLSELSKKDHKSYLVIKLFIRFLKREGALNPYIKNLKSQCCYREYSAHRKSIFSMKDILNGVLFEKRIFYNTINGGEMINYAFSWGSTKEGSKFWAELSLKWKEEFKDIIKKYTHMRDINKL